jgi:hypothetical protein
MRPAFIAIGIVIGASALGAFLGMRMKPAPPASGATFVIPRTSTPIKIDGELDEPSWVGSPARTGAFVGKPYSDARMLWDDTTLYLALYAADEDIETRATEPDAFHLVFDVKGVKHELDVSPDCVVTDHAWKSGARVACDTDGTINEPNDMDEEWVVEMALPLETVGIERDVPFHLSIERCDTPKHEQRSCTSWHELAVLK